MLHLHDARQCRLPPRFSRRLAAILLPALATIPLGGCGSEAESSAHAQSAQLVAARALFDRSLQEISTKTAAARSTREVDTIAHALAEARTKGFSETASRKADEVERTLESYVASLSNAEKTVEAARATVAPASKEVRGGRVAVDGATREIVQAAKDAVESTLFEREVLVEGLAELAEETEDPALIEALEEMQESEDDDSFWDDVLEFLSDVLRIIEFILVIIGSGDDGTSPTHSGDGLADGALSVSASAGSEGEHLVRLDVESVRPALVVAIDKRPEKTIRLCVNFEHGVLRNAVRSRSLIVKKLTTASNGGFPISATVAGCSDGQERIISWSGESAAPVIEAGN